MKKYNICNIMCFLGRLVEAKIVQTAMVYHQPVLKYQPLQARRVDSVEGGSFIIGRYFSALEVQASRGVWGCASPGNFANLGSL